ncbi:MAG: hypothetical protein U0835_17150 [Isosphaeraceae bacterium]
MARKLKAFVATSPLLHLWPCWASSRADAAQKLVDSLDASERKRVADIDLSRQAGPLRWCPRHERLWFTYGSRRVPVALHPSRVPDDLWPGIEVLETETLDERHSFAQGRGPREVSAAAFRERGGNLTS